MFLYISGDSYCAFRNDAQEHWPAVLASQLDLEIRGQGYPGLGWWPMKKDLENYINSEEFEMTRVFVLCHTSPHRPLMDDRYLYTKQLNVVNDFYYKHIHASEISLWTCKHWYTELNGLLRNRCVVHLFCFESDHLQNLEGTIKVDTPLLDISVRSAGGNINLPDYGGRDIREKMDSFKNHFSARTNFEFGLWLSTLITQSKFDFTNQSSVVSYGK